MRIAIVGISGYGAHYLELMDEHVKCFDELCAVVDPFAEISPYYERIARGGIPVYDTLEAFYQHGWADLVIISSPIQFHEAQSICAMENGSHVLCEKPLTATLEQAHRIQAVQQRTRKRFGVGFQWSFSSTMLKLKRNILDGAYGSPVCLKADVSWPRADAYYAGSTWKGRLRDAHGNPVMDSIVTNATAHYLHNIFFVLGDAMDTAQMPVSAEAQLYRARPIETFDTCFVRGALRGGATFYFGATHVGEREVAPRFHYAFEKADIYMAHDAAPIIVHWKDGRQDIIGMVNSVGAAAEKIARMREAAMQAVAPLCGIDAVIPHLTLCNALFDQAPIADFPAETVHKTGNPPGVAVEGLCDVADACYREVVLPDPAVVNWAIPSACLKL